MQTYLTLMESARVAGTLRVIVRPLATWASQSAPLRLVWATKVTQNFKQLYESSVRKQRFSHRRQP